MRNALLSEKLLFIALPFERAEPIVGDLVEEAQSRGRLWYAFAMAGVLAATFMACAGRAPGRTAFYLLTGLACWVLIYVGLRLIAAAAGVHPLFVDVHDYANMPWATAVYLAVVTACSNFLTGLCLGRLGTHFSPVAPLAVFWSATVIIAPFRDLALGSASWLCAAVYLAGVPLLYIAPLLVGGALAARGARPGAIR